MKTNRLEEMLSFIKERKQATLEELLNKFSISMTTLRRDINKLEKDGDIDKFYGGVKIRRRKELTPLSKRRLINYAGKISIAEEAATFVKDGDVIFLDSGSTVGAMAEFLGKHEDLTIITNNMLAMSKIVSASDDFKHAQLITLSGLYNFETYSFVGEKVSELLLTYNVGKAFMGTSGITLNANVTHSTVLEARVKKTATEKASFCYLLADHFKFDRAAPFTYAKFDQIDEVITDESPSDDFQKLFKEHLVKLRISG